MTYKGSLLIIDEFDSGFHSLLGKHLLNLFNLANTQSKHPQLLFISHNHDLWNSKILRRDQQLHMEKTKFGNTKAKTTYQYKVRKDKSVKRTYMNEKLTKLPILNNQQLKFDIE